MKSSLQITLFPSELGWMALLGADDVVHGLTFGHPSAAAALAAIDPQGLSTVAAPAPWSSTLMGRLQQYAAGSPDDFRDVPVSLGPLTEFQRRVIRRCRQIPFGRTLTYAMLAEKAGYPGAARAVGNCMAANRIPLIIPCHRVVGSGGGLGGYSARGGVKVKCRLLTLEGTKGRIERMKN